MRKSKFAIGLCASLVSLAALAASEANAQRRGGGGGGRSFSGASGGGGSFSRGGGVRSSASANVNRAGSANRGSFNAASANRGNVNTGNVNTGNVNTGNINRGNINRGNINTGDINIDRDVHVDVDGGYGCCGWNDWDYHPVAAGVAVGTAAAVASAWRLGAYYSTLPTNCVVVYRGTVTYYQCGTYWYQPVYSGMSVQYVAVKVP